jgi:hypothetical protein
MKKRGERERERARARERERERERETHTQTQTHTQIPEHGDTNRHSICTVLIHSTNVTYIVLKLLNT